MKAITPALTVAAVIGAVAILYVLAWPVEIDPAAWTSSGSFSHRRPDAQRSTDAD